MSSHTLPSFAQAFSAIDDRDRALPPIHSHPHSPFLRHESRHEARHDSHGPPPSLPPLKREARKRPLERDDSSDRPSSPRIVKQEQDVDQLDPSPPPQNKPSPPKAQSPAKPLRTRQQLHLNTNVSNASNNSNTTNNAGAAVSTTTNSNATATNVNPVPPPPPPSLVRQQHPPSKRRRVTISGVAHPNLHSSVSYGGVDPAHAHAHTPPPPTHTGPSTPISPVVMGFTIQRDPQAVEQVRAMLAVKQKQKALIESRRGSAAGLAGNEGGRRGSTAGIDSTGRRASVAAPSVTVNVVNPTPTSASGPGPGPGPTVAAPPLRRTGSSPNGQRLAPTPPTMSPNARVNASRTRSPSLLSGARITSPTPHGAPNPSQASRVAPLPPPPVSSNLSPPSHHPHPHAAPGRPPMQSPPRPAPPPTTNATNQSQNPPPTFVASQGLTALAHNLPPPPNSFTRRRAAQLGLRGNKPADLTISPRESESGPAPNVPASGSAAPHLQHPSPRLQQTQMQTQTQTQTQTHSALAKAPPHRAMHMPSVPVNSSFKALQPAIQSAPPRPGQQPGRFPMALPSLPPAIGQVGSAVHRGTSVRKTPGQVPPTPTRLSMQRAQGTTESASVRLSQPTGLPRIPRTATAATFATPHGPPTGSSALMPATPATLHRASGTGANSDKAAFLAPFEQFFDALSDAQVLKGWFGEQLRRVGAVVKEGEAQAMRLKAAAAEGGLSRSEIENLVRDAVQQEARGWRDEVARLRTQVAELQETISSLRTFEPDGSNATTSERNNTAQGRPVNGLSPRPPFQPTPPVSGASAGIYPTAPGVESYTFPPVPRPPTAPASSGSMSLHAQGPPPSSSAATIVDEVPQQSVSPPRDSVSAYGRSVSRSAASSPSPSFDGSGISRRLSVSAMRFEPQLQPLPTRRGVPNNDSEQKKEREKDKDKRARAAKPDLKRTNSHGGRGTATSSSRPKVDAGGEGGSGADTKEDKQRTSNSTAMHPVSPMDES